jgi:hypothetical protein
VHFVFHLVPLPRESFITSFLMQGTRPACESGAQCCAKNHTTIQLPCFVSKFRQWELFCYDMSHRSPGAGPGRGGSWLFKSRALGEGALYSRAGELCSQEVPRSHRALAREGNDRCRATTPRSPTSCCGR